MRVKKVEKSGKKSALFRVIQTVYFTPRKSIRVLKKKEHEGKQNHVKCEARYGKNKTTTPTKTV